MKKANAIDATRAMSATISFGENPILFTPFKLHYNKSQQKVTLFVEDFVSIAKIDIMSL